MKGNNSKVKDCGAAKENLKKSWSDELLINPLIDVPDISWASENESP